MSEEEEQTVDADAYMAMQEDREKGVVVLSPRNAQEAAIRRPYISVYRGLPHDQDTTLRVAYEQRFSQAKILKSHYILMHRDAIIDYLQGSGQRPEKVDVFKDDDLEMAPWSSDHSQSLRGHPGHRAKQIEEMTKMQGKPRPRNSLFSLLRKE